MPEVAEIFRLHGDQYRAKFADRMPAQHLRAMRDIEDCRTETLGGQVYVCLKCNQQRYSYHSCKNRHCPKCQNHQANEWLQEQQSLLLPTTYFMVTFTLPAQLRAVARSHQKTVYNILFRAAAQALDKLTRDPRFVGARIGMVGVLHTWTRALVYHPHVHFIVTGGGLSQDGRWVPARDDFLVPVNALSVIFRAKVRDSLEKAGLLREIAKPVWSKPWVVHAEPVGSGASAFKYLAPYIFRVAISNKRIVNLGNGLVTFNYKESATHRLKNCTLTAEEFIRRFLQHVLPPKFVKVRYYGLMSPRYRPLLEKARELIEPAPSRVRANLMAESLQSEKLNSSAEDCPQNHTQPDRAQLSKCPNCGGTMTLRGQIPSARDPRRWFTTTTPCPFSSTGRSP